MTPISIDVPHKLGRAGARERVRSRIGSLGSHIPGGFADVQSSWSGEDQLDLRINAMGQDVSARLEIKETVVTVQLVLPAMLSFFSGAIGSAVREGGERLLENKAG